MTLQYLQHDTELKIDGLLLQVITLLVQEIIALRKKGP